MQVLVLTETEIAEVLARRNGNAVATVEKPKRQRKSRKAKAESKPQPEHKGLDTTTMPTVEGRIEQGDTVEYTAASNGIAKAYKVTRVMESKFGPGNAVKLDGFLWRHENDCRLIAKANAESSDVPF
jgi:hypothetical protein